MKDYNPEIFTELKQEYCIRLTLSPNVLALFIFGFASPVKAAPLKKKNYMSRVGRVFTEMSQNGVITV